MFFFFLLLLFPTSFQVYSNVVLVPSGSWEWKNRHSVHRLCPNCRLGVFTSLDFFFFFNVAQRQKFCEPSPEGNTDLLVPTSRRRRVSAMLHCVQIPAFTVWRRRLLWSTVKTQQDPVIRVKPWQMIHKHWRALKFEWRLFRKACQAGGTKVVCFECESAAHCLNSRFRGTELCRSSS